MKICIVCKESGRKNCADQKDLIYQDRGEPTRIDLCYSHSVELFKMGQTNFVTKYRPARIESNFHPREVVNPLSNFFVFNSYK